MIWDLVKGAAMAGQGFFIKTINYCKDVVIEGIKNGAFAAISKVNSDMIKLTKKAYNSIKKAWEFVSSISQDAIKNLASKLWKEIEKWIGTVLSFTKEGGYEVGKIGFEIIINFFTAGSASGAKYMGNLMKILKNVKLPGVDKFNAIVNKVGDFLYAAEKTGDQTKRISKCKILGKGCFAKDTPVLMANNKYNINFGNTARTMAVAASMPIIAVPIQEVQLLDYAVAHETVNSTYGLTASTDDDIYLGLMDKDPYTSDQQRERDEYEINDTDWNEVVFEEVNGSSTAKLALHNEWINQKGYLVDGVVEMNLPEQGISGPFRITSIKHIKPQKKPIDDDEADDYNYKPVTALFTHESNQVYEINFDNGESLGVTYQHPIYSTTAGDWRLAGELEIGEQVLTKEGEATVIGSAKKEGQETVYNLEIKELHNFLVGKSGVVVHNNYGIAQAIVNGLKNIGKQFHLENYVCKEYGQALRNYLIKEGVKDPIALVYRVYDENGKRVICDLYHKGKKIAENGLHVGTPVNGKMYDNWHPEGLDIDIWRNEFDYPFKGNGYTLEFDIVESTQNIDDFL